MKKTIFLLFTLFVFSFSFSVFAEDLSGYDIMKKAEENPEPKTSSYKATMTLTNKNGQKRVREVIEREKDYGETKKTVIVFETPKDVSGVAYLMFDYDEKPDGTKPDSDNWLYMPAMKKTRRISGTDSGGNFMGTDFTYDDLGERGLNKDVFTLLGEENYDGKNCYKVEAVSKDLKEKDARKISWITKDDFLLVKAEYYDRQNSLHRVLTVKGYEKKNGYWVSESMFMENVQSGHTTLIEITDSLYDEPIDDNIFTVSALENRRVR